MNHIFILIKAFDSDDLSLPHLQQHGLKGIPQSARKANESLSVYIDSIVNSVSSMYDFLPLAEELDDTKEKVYIEGAKKQITVNAYERNARARNECIRINGSKCAICGFDFGSFYGKELAGKIHVHHVIPIHTISDNYVIDPIHDLVPVCPNCHMVLHLKSGGVYEIDEVKQMIVKAKEKHIQATICDPCADP